MLPSSKSRAVNTSKRVVTPGLVSTKDTKDTKVPLWRHPAAWINTTVFSTIPGISAPATCPGSASPKQDGTVRLQLSGRTRSGATGRKAKSISTKRKAGSSTLVEVSTGNEEPEGDDEECGPISLVVIDRDMTVNDAEEMDQVYDASESAVSGGRVYLSGTTTTTITEAVSERVTSQFKVLSALIHYFLFTSFPDKEAEQLFQKEVGRSTLSSNEI